MTQATKDELLQFWALMAESAIKAGNEKLVDYSIDRMEVISDEHIQEERRA